MARGGDDLYRGRTMCSQTLTRERGEAGDQGNSNLTSQRSLIFDIENANPVSNKKLGKGRFTLGETNTAELFEQERSEWAGGDLRTASTHEKKKCQRQLTKKKRGQAGENWSTENYKKI